MRSICVLSMLVFAGCAASGGSSAGTTPAPQPQPAAAPQELPGEYQQGLGNPFILVMNNLEVDLSIQVTDAAGYQYSAYVPPGQSYNLTVSPGAFTYYASAGGESDSGSYSVAYDNAYTWTWTREGGSYPAASTGYTWSQQSRDDFMSGCTDNGAKNNWEYCNCALGEFEKRWSEYDSPNEDEITLAVEPCFPLAPSSY